MMYQQRLNALVAVAIFLIVAGSGCDSKNNATSPPSEAEVTARLAKADAADGKTDKVVTKCGGCNLHMDGKPDLELAVGEYKMHFCNAGCRDRFAKAPEKEIMAMEVP